MNFIFPAVVLLLLFISFFTNKQKTLSALKISFKKFRSVLPLFVIVILLTSLVIGFMTPELIREILENSSNRWLLSAAAAVTGSIAIMPGFVAFPLSGILRQNGVMLMVISAFTTTLMMVGIVTFPIESGYIGAKAAVVRNIFGLIIAVLTALVTGLVFGEIF